MGDDPFLLVDVLRTSTCMLRRHYHATYYRLITDSGGTFLEGVQGNPNYFPILVQGEVVHGIGSI